MDVRLPPQVIADFDMTITQYWVDGIPIERGRWTADYVRLRFAAHLTWG